MSHQCMRVFITQTEAIIVKATHVNDFSYNCAIAKRNFNLGVSLNLFKASTKENIVNYFKLFKFIVRDKLEHS